MEKYIITAQAPIGEKTVEANNFEVEGPFIVFKKPIGEAAVKVYAIAIDKVFTIERADS